MHSLRTLPYTDHDVIMNHCTAVRTDKYFEQFTENIPHFHSVGIARDQFKGILDAKTCVVRIRSHLSMAGAPGRLKKSYTGTIFSYFRFGQGRELLSKSVIKHEML